MERFFQPNHKNATYIMEEMNRYADEQQARWQRHVGEDCAICLSPMPHHPWLGDQAQVQLLCCGNRICKECDDQRGPQLDKLTKKCEVNPTSENIKELKQLEKMVNSCVLCREPLGKPGPKGMIIYKGGKNELEKTFEWSKKGRGWASYSIAKRYSEGEEGISRNVVKAFKYFTLAAEQGDNKAMTDLGVVYIEGEGCKRDLHSAKKWFEAASKLENAKAMCYLSFLLSSTEFGVELDIPKAKQLILRSAELGFPQAQEKLGMYYGNGERGFDKDLTKAVHWLTQSSEQGEVNSFMALGIVLMEKAESQYGVLNITGKSPLPRAINLMRRGGKLGDKEAERRAKVTVEHFTKKECGHCGQPSIDNGGSAHLKNCAKCKVTFYCSTSCQRSGWVDGHKKDCCEYMG